MNKKQKTEMYPYAYVYRGYRRILIWQSNETDTFLLTREASLLQGDTLARLKKKLGALEAKIHWTEYAEINFDKFFTALRDLRTGKASTTKTCHVLLNGWNFIEDMGRTFNLKKELKGLRSKLLNKAYDKIFYGCNLPAVTPQGKSYGPLWSKEEIAAMRTEFRVIWKSFRKQGYIQP